ncbi:MAG: rhodanese-like domain-containing protein [Bacillota bacterium]
MPETSEERESYDEIPEDWDFALVDTREKEKFEKGHINGAINMPEDKDFKPVRLPFELDTKIIFYGPDCHEFIKKTENLGYKDVNLYEAGVEGWTRKENYLTTTPEYVSSLLHDSYVGEVENKPYQIIDTRGFSKYIESHIPTADSMEHTIFEDKYLEYMSASKDLEIITYCGGFF